MHLYCNNLSSMAIISSLIKSKLFPACFFCSNNFNISQSSSGSDGKNVYEIPQTMIAGQLSNFKRDLPLVLGRPLIFLSKFISSANLRYIFRPCRLQ